MSARLFVLGVLNERDAHGYEIREIAQEWRLEKWSDIGYGSIYHALGALEKEGLIVEVAVEREGGRPPRSVYRITDAGRRSLLELVRETAVIGFDERHPINLAIGFLILLPPDERAALLTERLRQMERAQERVAARRRELLPLGERAPWVLATLDHDLGHREFEIRWTRALLEQVRAWLPRKDDPETNP
jgi:DNA-binding PadR family transcriptional regulator